MDIDIYYTHISHTHTHTQTYTYKYTYTYNIHAHIHTSTYRHKHTRTCIMATTMKQTHTHMHASWRQQWGKRPTGFQHAHKHPPRFPPHMHAYIDVHTHIRVRTGLNARCGSIIDCHFEYRIHQGGRRPSQDIFNLRTCARCASACVRMREHARVRVCVCVHQCKREYVHGGQQTPCQPANHFLLLPRTPTPVLPLLLPPHWRPTPRHLAARGPPRGLRRPSRLSHGSQRPPLLCLSCVCRALRLRSRVEGSAHSALGCHRPPPAAQLQQPAILTPQANRRARAGV